MNLDTPKSVVSIDVVIALIVFLACVFLSFAMHTESISGFAAN